MTAAPREHQLRQIRDRFGLTLNELGRRVGTSATQISRLESSARKLSLEWMLRIAEALDISPTDILRGWSVKVQHRAAMTREAERRSNLVSPRFIAAPPWLEPSLDHFAVHVVDESAAALYPAGSFVFVRPLADPIKDLAHGQLVLVQRPADGSEPDPPPVLAAVEFSSNGDIVARVLLADSAVVPHVTLRAAEPRYRFRSATIHQFPHGRSERRDDEPPPADVGTVLGEVVAALEPVR